MDRRTFLFAAAGAPLVFGARELLAGQDDAEPSWWTSALKQMKDTSRRGVVLVAPEEAGERKTFGQALLVLAESEDPDVRELLFEAVVVCLTPDLARKLVAAGDDNRILVDEKGSRRHADRVNVETVDDPKSFVASFRAFLHGEKGERLREAAQGARERAGTEKEALEKAIDALDVPDAAPEVANILLREKAEAIAPWLVCARHEAVYAEGAARLRAIVDAAYEKRSSRLPFGTELPKFRSACGRWSEIPEGEERRVGVACGMAGQTKAGRRFLKVLTK